MSSDVVLFIETSASAVTVTDPSPNGIEIHAFGMQGDKGPKGDKGDPGPAGGGGVWGGITGSIRSQTDLVQLTIVQALVFG